MSPVGPVYLPIFPLPDLTFFPHTLLPLHVFETRYRAMIVDCLGRDRRLAVVALKPGYESSYHGKPAVHPVAGAGEIIQSERLATGRFNILLRGDGRVRIERELPTDTLYRMVHAVPLADTGAERPGVPPLLAAVKNLCRRVLDAVKRSTPQMEQALASEGPPGVLADQLAAALVPLPSIRQRLLEEPDVEVRLTLLESTLNGLLERLDRER